MLCVAYKENGILKRAEIPTLGNMTAEFIIPPDLAACETEVYVWSRGMKPFMKKQILTEGD